MEQKSDEWFEVRKGRMTASHAQAIGNCGKGLDSYIYELMGDFYSCADAERYSNEHMERGNELEEQARIMYEMGSHLKVYEVGFIEVGLYSGCSPDGLVSEVGGIEIKCVSDTNHMKMISKGVKAIESKYLWQIQMCLLLSGREWWDYVSYNPNFKKSLVVHRILPDPKKFEGLRAGLQMGGEKIEAIHGLMKDL